MKPLANCIAGVPALVDGQAAGHDQSHLLAGQVLVRQVAALADRYARRFGVDPLTIRFTDLRERVVALDGFDDDPKLSNEPKLEAIQMAWYEEFKDAQ
jgi:FeS assembly protein IscX